MACAGTGLGTEQTGVGEHIGDGGRPEMIEVDEVPQIGQWAVHEQEYVVRVRGRRAHLSKEWMRERMGIR